MTKTSGNRSAMIIIGILFFVFGFVTWLNGTLIPFLKLTCQLETVTEAFFVTFAFYMAYFFLAIPSARILQGTGFKNGMALGLLIMAAGSLIFIPAAQTRNFALFLTGLFVQGTGLALLQTASNPYISIIGPIESAAQRISIMGICNKGAGALSPLILGALILGNAGELEKKINETTDAAAKATMLDELAGRVIGPYIVMAVILAILAFLVRRSNLPNIDTSKSSEEAVATADQHKSIFQFPHLWLGVLCLFLYVGVEVMAGDAIGVFGNAAGISLDTTRYFTTFTLIAMLVGYVIGIFTIPKYISQQNALKISALTGIAFSLGIYLSSGYVAIVFIALLGLSNALMWPAIFPLAIKGLGRHTQMGSALLVMGIAGGAILPLLYGFLKDSWHIPNATAFTLCTLPCYLYICYYAIKGHKAGETTGQLATA
ncbi:sugar MFS transporter [Paraflavitalea sp. CAU 1676]|uniref:sugar MFS transporter n=1 Tax=Paraflavitalea sp. CAU 1676 TaxID=3032598 RepID=UPI0023DC2D41|nr:sugar MFS transporter [Paraflavitalea sp. CAU 1676]MDF2189030.1 sugar MFS transporter [Paraflavitalea sp. CAU 1676]